MERNLEVFAEFHEFTQIDLIHRFLHFFEFAALRDMLARIKAENFLHSSLSQFIDVQNGWYLRLFVRGIRNFESFLALCFIELC